jgi:hypothetical protein
LIIQHEYQRWAGMYNESIVPSLGSFFAPKLVIQSPKNSRQKIHPCVQLGLPLAPLAPSPPSWQAKDINLLSGNVALELIRTILFSKNDCFRQQNICFQTTLRGIPRLLDIAHYPEWSAYAHEVLLEQRIKASSA